MWVVTGLCSSYIWLTEDVQYELRHSRMSMNSALDNQDCSDHTEPYVLGYRVMFKYLQNEFAFD
jgi:hypothetical protein